MQAEGGVPNAGRNVVWRRGEMHNRIAAFCVRRAVVSRLIETEHPIRWINCAVSEAAQEILRGEDEWVQMADCCRTVWTDPGA